MIKKIRCMGFIAAAITSVPALAQVDKVRCELSIPLSADSSYEYALEALVQSNEQGGILQLDEPTLDLVLAQSGAESFTYLSRAALEIVSLSERFVMLDYPHALEKLSIRLSRDAAGQMRAQVYHAHTATRGLEASETLPCSVLETE